MSLRIKPRFKIATFDRSVIRRDWGKIKRDPLVRGGLLVRKIARGSIRRVKTDRPSEPGRPPRAHSNARGAPFKLIYSVPDGTGLNLRVLIGMVGFVDSEKAIPGLHEHGGYRTLRVKKEVFVHGKSRKKHGKYAKRHFRGTTIKTVRYPPRPFMFPALVKAKSKLPRMWRDSIGR